MEILKKTPSGNIIIDEKVISDIAGITVSRINDVYPNKKEGKFVKVSHKDSQINLEIFLKLKQGCDVNKLCTEVQSSVYDSVETVTDIKLTNIDINIQGFVK